MEDPRPPTDDPLEEKTDTLEPGEVAALYAAHADALQRFLWGVLRDHAQIQDVLQATFVKLVERGPETREETRKAWLFRVAYHEALAWKRRQATTQRVVNKLGATSDTPSSPVDSLVRFETVEQVRRAIEQLPPAQQEVVRLRIYEDKTFAEIAEQLDIPLGTALTRMRAAVAKLKLGLQ